jgi:hypothetical protein
MKYPTQNISHFIIPLLVAENDQDSEKGDLSWKKLFLWYNSENLANMLPPSLSNLIWVIVH